MSDIHRAASARPEISFAPLSEPLFDLGTVVATPAVLEHFRCHGIDPFDYLRRHRCGDWGELCAEDIAANRSAVQNGSRILSSYRVAGEKVWVITEEADCRVTTILFPSEY